MLKSLQSHVTSIDVKGFIPEQIEVKTKMSAILQTAFYVHFSVKFAKFILKLHWVDPMNNMSTYVQIMDCLWFWCNFINGNWFISMSLIDAWSLVRDWWEVIIGLDNGLAPNRRHSKFLHEWWPRSALGRDELDMGSNDTFIRIFTRIDTQLTVYILCRLYFHAKHIRVVDIVFNPFGMCKIAGFLADTSALAVREQ